MTLLKTKMIENKISIDWHQIGIRLALDWKIAFGLANDRLNWLTLDWKWIGTRLAIDWHWIGIRLAQDWRWIGTALTVDRIGRWIGVSAVSCEWWRLETLRWVPYSTSSIRSVYNVRTEWQSIGEDWRCIDRFLMDWQTCPCELVKYIGLTGWWWILTLIEDWHWHWIGRLVWNWQWMRAH